MTPRKRRLTVTVDPELVEAGNRAVASGARQARLARALQGITIEAIAQRLGRAAGELLAATGCSDVIDACLALLSTDGDEIVTLDRGDIEILVAATGLHVELIPP